MRLLFVRTKSHGTFCIAATSKAAAKVAIKNALEQFSDNCLWRLTDEKGFWEDGNTTESLDSDVNVKWTGFR